MSDSKDQINMLMTQINTLQSKLQKALDNNSKLSDRIIQLTTASTMHPTPVPQPLPHPQPATVDLLDMQQGTFTARPSTAPQKKDTDPQPNNPTTPHIPQVDSTNMELIKRLIQITETQVQLQGQKKDLRNNKFPPFNGDDLDEFLAWYNNVLSILASTGWNALYDVTSDSPIPEATAQLDPKLSSLSADLYSYLHVAMKKDAQTLMEDKTELRGKGLLFLQTLFDSYNITLNGSELMDKEKEYANIYRYKDEKVTTYASRCKKLRRILRFNGISAPPEGLKLRFIMGLGPEFSDIQKNLHHLPDDWKTLDMKKLAITATSYLNSIHSIRKNNAWYKSQQSNAPQSNPQPSTDNSKKSSTAKTSKSNTKESDRKDNAKKYEIANSERQARILRDIRDGTFSASKYISEVPKGACVWHGTVHKDPKCNVLTNLLQPPVSTTALKPSSFSQPPPKAKHTSSSQSSIHTPPPMGDINIMDLNMFDQASISSKDNANNNTSHNYSSCNNFISCRASSPTSNIHAYTATTSSHRFILDSGAFPHMCNQKSLFTNLYPWGKHESIQAVTLADGVTTSPILGIGNVSFYLDDHNITLTNVLFVPALSDSLFSIKQHSMYQGNYFHVENNIATLAFPKSTHSIPIADEIYITVHPTSAYYTSKRIQQQKTDTNNHSSQPSPIQSDVTSPEMFSTTHSDKKCISCKLLHHNSIIPTKGTPQSAGFDLFAVKQQTILPNTRQLIPTGIALEIPLGFYGRIAPRSSLTIKHNIDIGAGVIDADYRGEIYACLINNSTKPFNIKPGEKIAQLLIESNPSCHLQPSDTLTTTIRGEGGFGSTDLPKPSATPPSMIIPKWMTTNSTLITFKFPKTSHFEYAKMSRTINGFSVQSTLSDKFN